MRGGRTFTLIELLVVVAIISVLMSLLLPALGASKELARKTKCSGNLKSVGICIQSYSMDNADWLPASYTGGALWFQTFPIDYSGASVESIAINGVFGRSRLSLKPDWMTVCPSYKDLKQNGNYGVSKSWFAHESWGKPFHKIQEIKAFSSTLFATEVYYEGTNTNSSEQFITAEGMANVHFRHNGACNCLMADGHAESRNSALPASASDIIWSGHN